MKTNVVMKRPMGQFEVLQRTSDGFFDGNALLSQWNSIRNNPERKMAKFFNASQTKDFIDALIDDLKSHSSKMNNGDYQVVKEIKGRNTKKGRTRDQVWMHPYLFIKFAMWINPRFELQVIKFVYDELIKYRHDAGDKYNEMTAAVASIPNSDYSKVAIAINWIVFNKHFKNIRQDATEKQLREISEIEHTIATMISLDMISDYQTLINTLRKMYNQKYQKF